MKALKKGKKRQKPQVEIPDDNLVFDIADLAQLEAAFTYYYNFWLQELKKQHFEEGLHSSYADYAQKRDTIIARINQCREFAEKYGLSIV